MAEKTTQPAPTGERLAKVIARAGLCSRRDAEKWIAEGRIGVDGKTVKTPATNVTPDQTISLDGEPIAARHGTRLWLYHKPSGLVVTEKDPEGRETIFEKLEAQGLPRVLTVGRLDINTEGLLLLTNDGGLKRVLELPSTGWLRRYRVRAFGSIDQSRLDTLKKGISVDGVNYGPIEAVLERVQGGNVWLVVALREGKNREVKNVLGALGLAVNRLIRISYGPFQLGDLPIGSVTLVKAKVLRDQLGEKLAERAGVDFDSAFPEEAQPKPAKKPSRNPRDPNARLGKGPERAGKKPAAPKPRTGEPRFAKQRAEGKVPNPRGEKRFGEDKPATRRVLFDDGRQIVEEAPPQRRERRDAEDGPGRRFGGHERDDAPRGRGRDSGPRDFGDRPRRSDDRQRDRGPRDESRPARDGRPERSFADRKPARPGSRPEGRGPGPNSPREGGRPSGPRGDARRAGPRDDARSGGPRGGSRPAGGRPTGGKPGGGRPSGGKPSGGRPSGPRGRGPK